MKLAMAMRDEAAELARKTAAQNHAQSKIQLQNVTNACNRCHQTFRVNVKVRPAAEEKNAE
jgi:cytochrome c556